MSSQRKKSIKDNESKIVSFNIDLKPDIDSQLSAEKFKELYEKFPEHALQLSLYLS